MKDDLVADANHRVKQAYVAIVNVDRISVNGLYPGDALKKSTIKDDEKSNSPLDSSLGDDSDVRSVSEVAFVKVMSLIHFGLEDAQLRDLVFRL